MVKCQLTGFECVILEDAFSMCSVWIQAGRQHSGHSVLVPILGTRSRGIYCGERQSERRVMSRERYQNVVGAVSNKCRGWKVLGTKGSGSYNTAASVQSPQTGLCPPLQQSTFSLISAMQAVTSVCTRGSQPFVLSFTWL